MALSSWLVVVYVVLTATQSAHAAKSVFAATTSKCSSVDTCYAGGAPSTPCTISDGGCPPCITFSDDGCYVQVNGACPFGVDCSSVWNGAPTSTASGSATSPTTTNSGTSTTSTDTTTGVSTIASPSAAVNLSSKSASGTDDTTSVSSGSIESSTSGSIESPAETTSSGSSDMSVVFAIIGAAIGVIAVAVIFLTLVRRSNAAHDEDEDDMSNTPPAFSKAPVAHASHTTGAATYSSYNGAPAMGSGNGPEVGPDAAKGVSMNAMSYYNQQPPHTSTAPSPRVAGRAIPSQPVGMNVSTGMAHPYGGSQNFGVSGVGVTSGFGTSGFGKSGVGVNNQAPPTPVQHLPMGGVAPSPHSQRESYEF